MHNSYNHSDKLDHDIIIIFQSTTTSKSIKAITSLETHRYTTQAQVDHITTNCSYCHHLQLDNMQGQARGDKCARLSCGYQREGVHEVRKSLLKRKRIPS